VAHSAKLLAVVLAVTMISFLTTTAHADFTGPSIALWPTSGPPGTTVAITGSGFDQDFACDISSSPGGLISSPTCTIGDGYVSASFIVGNVPDGLYIVTVTGYSLGYALGGLAIQAIQQVDPNQASAPFTVTEPVGGHVEPVNKLSIIAPYLALLLGMVGAIAIVVVRPWKKPESRLSRSA
jgi:hypothetical protein